MKTLSQVRQAYEDNYAKMTALISEMGGDECIKFHRKKRSSLYSKLKELQRHEHYLDELENRMHNTQYSYH